MLAYNLQFTVSNNFKAVSYTHLDVYKRQRVGKAAEATETSTAQIAAVSAAETHAADAQKRMEEIICRAFAEIER